MDPETGRALFGFMMTFLVLLVFSFLFMPAGSPSFTIAVAATTMWLIFLSALIYEIRREAK